MLILLLVGKLEFLRGVVSYDTVFTAIFMGLR